MSDSVAANTGDPQYDNLSAQEERDAFYRARVPRHILEALEAWKMGDHPHAPGGFVEACLKNDLMGAFQRADARSLRALQYIVGWLYWNMPTDIWGSEEKYEAHLERMIRHGGMG